MIFIFDYSRPPIPPPPPQQKRVYTPKTSLHPPKEVYTPQNKSTSDKTSLHPPKKSTPQKVYTPQAEDGLSEEQLVAVRVLRLETVPVGRIPFR